MPASAREAPRPPRRLSPHPFPRGPPSTLIRLQSLSEIFCVPLAFTSCETASDEERLRRHENNEKDETLFCFSSFFVCFLILLQCTKSDATIKEFVRSLAKRGKTVN